jgi:N-methylhydantoinase A
MDKNQNLIGVDIGGTFTDLVGYVNDQLIISKTLTTVENPALGVSQAIQISDASLSTIAEFLHGSTIAINIVLEKKGAKTALLTTNGFRDVYEIGRSNRPEAFDLNFTRPKPLISREFRIEVNERMTARGEILNAIDEKEVIEIGKNLIKSGIESIAICFLHSYANPTNEIAAGSILRKAFPNLFITLSHEILREFREYERTSTVALNAYVGPKVKNYLNFLSHDLKKMGFYGSTQIMRSNGGSMSLSHACREPVSMMESGPVAGMIAAGEVAKLLNIEKAIGFDMGGTTAKATLIIDGIPTIDEGYHIGGYSSGQPMQLPVVSIVEVGSGGGSVAWCDQSRGLHVGPISAGSDPGPVCYSRGGVEPTVTDANLILGRLNPNRFLGGGMNLDISAAKKILNEKIAYRLNLSVNEAALGVINIADNAMSLAVRAVSIRKGVDPRDAVMIAFGGGGPVHAASLCKEINIPKLVIPKMPGNFSALGMLLAPWRHDFSRIIVSTIGKINRTEIATLKNELIESAKRKIEEDGLNSDKAIFDYSVNLRYRGQEHSIQIPVEDIFHLCEKTEKVKEEFNFHHERRYGHAAIGEIIEIVNIRLCVSLPRDNLKASDYIKEKWKATGVSEIQYRDVIFNDSDNPQKAQILWRPNLAPGFSLTGPAIIEEPNSTTVLFPGDKLTVHEQGHLIIDIELDHRES